MAPYPHDPDLEEDDDDSPAPPPGGRRMRYSRAWDRQVEILAELGANDHIFARFFGTTPDQIEEWRATEPEFRKRAVLDNDAMLDTVERSLFQRATGYTFESEKITTDKKGRVQRTATARHVPPDIKAAALILTNGRPDKWRDRSGSAPLGNRKALLERIAQMREFDTDPDEDDEAEGL